MIASSCASNSITVFFTISAASPATVINAPPLVYSVSCLTDTPTPSPTPTPAACTLTGATLSWASDDAGEIFINGNLINVCPNGCWTGYNNISIPLADINATGDNVLAAYGYATDDIVSCSTWLLTLNYSNCSSTYVMPNYCVLNQYLNDPNSASSGLPANFPAGWNNTGFNDSGWSAPGTIFLMPATYSEDETIPYPPGGGVSWIWGTPNWVNVTPGDGYMFREHFQVGVPQCLVPPLTPTPTPTATFTQTPTFTPTYSPTQTFTFTPSLTPTVTTTPTITFTPTITNTPTITDTPTITFTPTVTFTPTNTPVGLHLWPNPYNPNYAYDGQLRVYQAPTNAILSIYTVSGELVINADADNQGWIYWNGRNRYGALVSGGIYYYVVQAGDDVLLTGKLLIVRNRT